jgi:protein-export membrane protein SecD
MIHRPMRTFWTGVAKGIAAIAAAAAVVVVVSPEQIVWSLPAWLQDQLVPDGPQVVLEVEPDGVDLQQAVEESIGIVKRRLYELAWRASVRQQGPARIVVRLSTSADTKRLIEMATRPGKFEFRLIDATMTVAQALARRPPQNSEVLHDGKKTPYLVEKQVLMSGRDIVDAWSQFDQLDRGPVVTIKFNSGGTREFGQLTQANVGRSLAFVFDSEVLSAPVIREPILAEMAQIAGAFTVERSIEMATLLRAGELPGRLVIVDRDLSD